MDRTYIYIIFCSGGGWGRSVSHVFYGVWRLALEGVCVWEEDVLSECEQRHVKADGVRTTGLYTPYRFIAYRLTG